jgi:hypothetical protein
MVRRPTIKQATFRVPGSRDHAPRVDPETLDPETLGCVTPSGNKMGENSSTKRLLARSLFRDEPALMPAMKMMII